MFIEIAHPGKEEFYKETVNVTVQHKRLLKDPECKLRNMYRRTLVITAVVVIGLALQIAECLAWGFRPLNVALITLLVMIVIIYVLYLSLLKKNQRTMADSFRPKVLTLDDKGIALEEENGNSLRVSWECVAFVRILQYGVCFVCKDTNQILINVDREYEAQIRAFLAGRPEIRLIEP